MSYVRIGIRYPQEVVELARRLPFSTDQVMGVFKDQDRNIEDTEKALEVYMRTGIYVRKSDLITQFTVYGNDCPDGRCEF